MLGIELKSKTKEGQYDEALIWMDMIDALTNLGLFDRKTKESMITDGWVRIYFYDD
jgi:hypothetical protein